ncbi:PREDICTED: alanine racemase-like [Priapulus caudatus]|uniref:Alanine racemase-like n=1 Tax=Priapulus caudatus TaxID=37621 RepID=A0ABM1F6I2_PRICU|nr:PREDICTED: alanine racemase-like [Priapulus caudatus]
MDSNIFAKTGHCSYIRVDLDAITNNVNILRSRVATNTELIAVVKGGGYGHGGVPVSRHLKSIGVRALAVATGGEGRSLRKGGLQGKIHVVGNFQPEDIDCIVENDLIPTVSWSNGLKSIPKDKLVNKVS